ncbi:MAG: protein kinase [Leptospiraceae bacterium]|nr:protein kinase [Leptospiraceae bacterium]
MNQETRREDLTKIEQNKKPTSGGLLSYFKDYEVVKELNAQGGEADNYIIQKDGNQYFLKLYRKGFNPNIQLLKNLKEISKKIKQHVVQIYDVGYDEDLQRYYEILEYIENGDLSTLKEELVHYPQQKKEKIIDTIINEVHLALKSLHENNIIHRDLKPKNILIRNKEPLNLVLIDFGISRTLDEELSKINTTSFKGTTSYIAPEEISNYFGKEIDWWHLGVIVLELLTGNHPFRNLSEQAIINILTTKGIEIPESLPNKYKHLLKGLLTRDYEKRWGFEQVNEWLQGNKDIPVYYEETKHSDSKIDESEWQKYGIPKNSPWRNIDLEPAKLITFKDADFGVNEARVWINAGWTNGKSARKWYDRGFEPEEAYIFENFGFSLSQANTLKAKSINAYDLNLIKDYIEDLEEFVSDLFKLLNQYDIKGILREYPKWKKEGISFREAVIWYNEKFDPKEARTFIDNGISINQAKNSKTRYQKWLEQGFSLTEAINFEKAAISVYNAKEIKNSNLNIQDVLMWLKSGFSVEDAITYIKENISVEEAKQWKRIGLLPKEALEWIKQKIPIDEAKKWINEGISVEEAKKWKDGGYSSEDAKKWWREGFYYDKAIQWMELNVDLKEIKKWINAGFGNPKEVKKWFNAKIDVEEAKEWKKLRLDVSEAKKWKTAKISLEEAKSWILAGIDFEERTKWLNAGFNFGEIKKAIELNLDLQECIEGKQMGFSFEEIKILKEKKIKLIDAKEWKNENIPTNIAINFINAGIPIKEAKQWYSKNISFEEAIKWYKENISFEEAIKWINDGYYFNDASPWILNGYYYQDAKKCLEAGINIKELKIFSNLKMNFEEALNWKNAGFKIEEIIYWKKLNVKLNNAIKYKNDGITSSFYRNFIFISLSIYILAFFIFSYEFYKMQDVWIFQFFLIVVWWFLWSLLSIVYNMIKFYLIRKTFKHIKFDVAKYLFYIYCIVLIIFLYKSWIESGNYSKTILNLLYNISISLMINFIIYLSTRYFFKKSKVL